MPDNDDYTINEQIDARRVILIDETGRKLGLFMVNDALGLARDRGLDLVQMSNDQDPVCKMIDMGKYRYEQSRRKRANKKKSPTTKELQFRPKIGEHDFQVKLKNCRKFLQQGNRVRVVIRFRGREMAHVYQGEELCQRLAEAVQDLGQVDSPAVLAGRQMGMLLVPLT